ncbi:hypothetical protein IIA94_00225 [Patescibacteria group bacterium]|nr:hypothetical protein [Patescibacteria group bacterium]
MISPKRKTFIVFFAVVAVNLLFLGLVSYSVLGRIIINSGQFVSQERAFAQAEVDTENIQRFQKFQAIKEQEFKRFEAVFLDPNTPISFLEFIENLAQGFQLELQVSPGNPEKIQGDPWRSLNFTLAIAGSYGSVAGFVEKLELAPYVLEVVSLRITQATQEADGNVQATLVLKVYTNEN